MATARMKALVLLVLLAQAACARGTTALVSEASTPTPPAAKSVGAPQPPPQPSCDATRRGGLEDPFDPRPFGAQSLAEVPHDGANAGRWPELGVGEKPHGRPSLRGRVEQANERWLGVADDARERTDSDPRDHGLQNIGGGRRVQGAGEASDAVSDEVLGRLRGRADRDVRLAAVDVDQGVERQKLDFDCRMLPNEGGNGPVDKGGEGAGERHAHQPAQAPIVPDHSTRQLLELFAHAFARFEHRLPRRSEHQPAGRALDPAAGFMDEGFVAPGNERDVSVKAEVLKALGEGRDCYITLMDCGWPRAASSSARTGNGRVSPISPVRPPPRPT
jgi:hypothetical protein